MCMCSPRVHICVTVSMCRQGVGVSCVLVCQSINQYFMSVHIEVISDKKHNKKQHIITIYTNFPTGLWTISLTILVITSVLYKISYIVCKKCLCVGGHGYSPDFGWELQWSMPSAENSRASHLHAEWPYPQDINLRLGQQQHEQQGNETGYWHTHCAWLSIRTGGARYFRFIWILTFFRWIVLYIYI